MAADEKAIAEAAETARHYLDPILLQPLSEMGLLLRDTVSFWRFKNQVNTILKAKKFLDAKGIDPAKLERCVDPEFVVPLLEASASTGDETLSAMFSGLLATAIQDDAADYTHRSFVQVLSNLSPLDAQILLTFKKQIENSVENETITNLLEGVPPYRHFGVRAESFVQGTFKLPQIMLSYENIWRLGICDRGPHPLTRANLDRIIFATAYGWAFLNACTKDINLETTR